MNENVMRVATLLGLLASLGCSESTPEAVPLSGVLITMDTTNAMALDLYGRDRGLTPNLAKLAESSLVYDRAHTSVPITLPAHTSMMTGLYPLRHGVRDNGLMRLSPRAQTLAELAQEAGFQTAAFLSAAVLSATYGLDQGFDLYEDRPPGEKRARETGGRRSDNVTDAALQWLEQRDPQRPFFLWVHYFDPHFPYDPPAEFLDIAEGNSYLGEVAAMDHDIGRLLDALSSDVGLDRLMLAVVADHGESHGRHEEPSHSVFIYETTVHIPFVLRFPDGRRAGERSPEMVSVVDVFPTFLDELGLAVPAGVDGISLAHAPVPEDRGVYVESYTGFLNFGWSPLAGWIDSRGKYLHSSRPEAYDIESDPKELADLVASGSFDAAPYIAALEGLSRRPRLSSDSNVQLDEEQLAELRALGYAAAGDLDEDGLPGPLDPSNLAAPSEGADTYTKYCAAISELANHNTRAGIELLRDVLRASPDNFTALGLLGGALTQQGEYPEAIEVLERSLLFNSRKHSTLVNLAFAYDATGDPQSSLKYYRAAQVIRPGVARVDKQVARLEQQLQED